MRQDDLQAPDFYGRTQQLDEATLGVLATRLEARGRHPFFLSTIEHYLDALGLAGPEAILDLGCGTGVAARAVARRGGLHGTILGVDISAGLIEAAVKLTAAEGLDGRVSFRTGDAHSLGLEEHAFDVVLMHTLVSHVADPLAVLVEGRRLLRRGSGRLVVFDGDYASVTYATDAADGGVATDAAVQRALVANPRVMRSMPRLLAAAGLDLVWSRPYVMADIGRADFWASSLASMRVLLPRIGVMTAAEVTDWADELDRASAENRFFGAANFYSYVARAR